MGANGMRVYQERRRADEIQQPLLPKDVPALSGWQVSTYYQPARAVGGDFYEFFSFEDGRLGLVIGDVTDKGILAALVVATTRCILRSVAQAQVSPGQALAQANALLGQDIPPKMFVTCFYAILDPATGRLHYANAGHDLPYRHRPGYVAALRATGMPLGLRPGMTYEEHKTILEPGEQVLFYSDGLVEAHDQKREMFGFPRLMALLAQSQGADGVIAFLLRQLAGFTGPEWEQEDDVTLVTLQRLECHQTRVHPPLPRRGIQTAKSAWTGLALANLSLPSGSGNRHLASERPEQRESLPRCRVG